MRKIARIALSCVVALMALGMALPAAWSDPADELPHPRETIHYQIQVYPFHDCVGRIEYGFHGPPVAHYGQCEIDP